VEDGTRPCIESVTVVDEGGIKGRQLEDRSHRESMFECLERRLRLITPLKGRLLEEVGEWCIDCTKILDVLVAVAYKP
jgi:hypothetical protein